MTLHEMINILRLHLSDEQMVGWPDNTELYAHLDKAANYYSEQLIAAKDVTMLKKLSVNISVSGNMPMPDDFVSFSGNVPITVIGRTFEFYGDYPIVVLYWSKFIAPSVLKVNLHAQLPYTHEQALAIIDIARVFALNKNEYDLSQDLALYDRHKESFTAARKD